MKTSMLSTTEYKDKLYDFNWLDDNSLDNYNTLEDRWFDWLHSTYADDLSEYKARVIFNRATEHNAEAGCSFCRYDKEEDIERRFRDLIDLYREVC